MSSETYSGIPPTDILTYPELLPPHSSSYTTRPPQPGCRQLSTPPSYLSTHEQTVPQYHSHFLHPNQHPLFYFSPISNFFNMAKKTQIAADSSKTPLPKTKKEKSREKEYRRAQNINSAFENLQHRIPYLKPEERKQLPKIKTLRLAMQYISHLTNLLSGDQMHQSDCTTEVRPLEHTDFRQTVASEMRVRNSYRERAHQQEMDTATVQRILAREEQRSRRFHGEEMPGYSPQPFAPHPMNSHNFRQISANEYNRMQNQMAMPMQPEPQCYYPISPDQYHPHTMENTYVYHH